MLVQLAQQVIPGRLAQQVILVQLAQLVIPGRLALQAKQDRRAILAQLAPRATLARLVHQAIQGPRGWKGQPDQKGLRELIRGEPIQTP